MTNTAAQQKLAWAKRYAASHHPGFVDAETQYRKAIEELLTPETRAFDAGCGHGGPVQDHREEIALVAGADLDFAALKINPNLDGRAVMADLEHLPFCSEAFDLITSQWVLEHLPKPEITFSEFDRMLSPGGRFVTITPNLANPLMRLSRIMPTGIKSRLMAKLGRGEQDTYPTYYLANTITGLRKLGADVGWEIEKLETFGAPFYFIFSRMLFKLAIWMDKRDLKKPIAEHKAHIFIVFRKSAAS